MMKSQPDGYTTIYRVIVNLRDGSTREIVENILYNQCSFADAITKLTVTEDTDPNLLREWGKDYGIGPQVLYIMKKPAVRTPVSQRPPKRETPKKVYNRKQSRKELLKDEKDSTDTGQGCSGG